MGVEFSNCMSAGLHKFTRPNHVGLLLLLVLNTATPQKHAIGLYHEAGV